MKRFTETTKWDDPWFWELSTPSKLLWLYLLDHCDNAGVVELNTKFASLKVGETIEEHHLSELGSRVNRLPSGKLHILKFVRFQFGELTTTSVIHQSVIKLLHGHGIPIPCSSHGQGIGIPCPSPKDKDKDKDKDPEGGAGGRITNPTLDMIKLQGAKVGLPDPECERFFDYYESNGWRVGKNRMRSWTSAMANWKRNYQNYGTHTRTNNAKENPRNIGIVRGPTDYSTAKPRLQREREEAERLAKQVAKSNNHPPTNSNPTG